jgi:preprotein translocase subunit SecD
MKQLAAKVASDAAATAAEITSDTEEWTASGRHVDWFLRADDRRQEMTPDEARQHHCFGRTEGNIVRCEVPGRRVLETYVDDLARRDPAFAIPPGRMLAFERVPAVATTRPAWRSYLIERTVVVSGASIRGATPVSDDRHVRVDVVLDDTASHSLAAALEPHAGDKLVLVLDGAVLSAPIVQAVPHDGHLSIGADAGAARDLAIVLASGELPGPMREELQTRLTPSDR